MQDRSAPDGPKRNQTSISHDISLGRDGTELPEQPTVPGRQTVQVPIVGTNKNPILPRDRSQSNRAISVKSPLLPAGIDIQGCHTVIE
ncbi:MAG: hypothetical protein RQ760_18965 [Sedimentisphaerales bacterium]|nr:hypothetical protein [Sedimentisphaerales bacterium]